MILALECIITSIIFGIAIVGATIHNKINWLHEYSPEVQKRYIETHPEYSESEEKARTNVDTIKKIIGCIIFIIILTALVVFAGADSFLTGMIYCYIIWFTVNLFDVIVLDIGIFAHWKKVRLPGTEDMDSEYCSNAGKSIRDGVKGLLIGLPAAAVCGLMTMIISG